MNQRQIKTLIRDFEASTLTELAIETADFSIRMTKDGHGQIKQRPIMTEEAPEQRLMAENPKPNPTNETTIHSPLIGTFYASPGPEQKAFVKKGDVVNKGDVVCIVEAMKIMNEIVAPHAGEVIEILVESGEAVGYNHPLLVIRKQAYAT